jgi:hypothetical protein
MSDTNLSYPLEAGGVRLSETLGSENLGDNEGPAGMGSWIMDPTRRRRVAREIATTSAFGSSVSGTPSARSIASSVTGAMEEEEETQSIKSVVTYHSSGFARVKASTTILDMTVLMEAAGREDTETTSKGHQASIMGH